MLTCVRVQIVFRSFLYETGSKNVLSKFSNQHLISVLHFELANEAKQLSEPGVLVCADDMAVSQVVDR